MGIHTREKNGQYSYISKRKKYFIYLAAVVAVSIILSVIILANKNNNSKVIAIQGTEPDQTVVTDPGIDQKPGETQKDPEDNNIQPHETQPAEEESPLKYVTDQKLYSRKLVEEGSRNILFAGEDKASGLYDTIGIINIDDNTKKVKIIMIPRDMYIQYSDRVLRFLEKEGLNNQPGTYKINYTYYIGYLMGYQGKFNMKSISFLTQAIEEKFSLTIHDYIKINTKGFIEIVDLFGGVYIDVPYDMNYEDPEQDLYIHIDKGVQFLDGIQSEGFVRYRQGYDKDGVYHEYGDIARKNNQLCFMKEFISQHGTLGNLDKVPKLIASLSNNVKHSIGLGDMLTKYIGIARKVVSEEYQIESITLSSNNTKFIKGSYYLILD